MVLGRTEGARSATRRGSSRGRPGVVEGSSWVVLDEANDTLVHPGGHVEGGCEGRARGRAGRGVARSRFDWISRCHGAMERRRAVSRAVGGVRPAGRLGHPARGPDEPRIRRAASRRAPRLQRRNSYRLCALCARTSDASEPSRDPGASLDLRSIRRTGRTAPKIVWAPQKNSWANFGDGRRPRAPTSLLP